MKFDNFWLSEFHNGSGTKKGFNSCECIKFLNIANIHALDVWEKRILICNNKIFFLCFCNATFLHSSYVIKSLQPSSAFTGHFRVRC